MSLVLARYLGRFAVPLLLSLMAAGAGGWLWVGKARAEREAERLGGLYEKANGQVQALSASLESQNKGVQALATQLAERQKAVDAAQAEAAAKLRSAQRRIADLQRAPIPESCPEAVDWLGEQMRAQDGGRP